MPSIDERVVAMAFENARFEAGIAQTMKSLSKLDAALQTIGSKNSLADIEKAASKVTLEQPMSALEKLKARFGRAGEGAADGFNEIEKSANKVTLEQPMTALERLKARLGNAGQGAADGFNEIEKASNHVSLNGLTRSLDTVTAKFSVLQGAATVALGNITSQAMQKGASFAKGFAFGPINQGLEEYKTNLGSIQTILANTEGQRVSGLGEVNKHLAELNKYSDQTIYNFSQMAKNIGTFTAAGVDLDKSTQSIKGIANLAALSGSSSQQASTAMYQLSQAIAAGRVGLQDWNSVVNAGMGGAKFQQALMRTAENMGAVEKGAVKIDKATGKATVNGESFRNSIMAKPGEESWLTSDVLTNTLQQFTGDMTDAELAAQGFTEEQIKAIQAQAKTAKEAATQVKTLSQVFDVAKESIGSGWAKTFQLIFGDFKEAKKTFTELSNFLSGIIGNSAKARNDMLADWKKLGGRDVLIEGIKNAFKALQAVLEPIHDAFRDIFPAKTGKDLFAMTKGFADLMERLKPSKEVVDGLHRTFRGLFAALDIGWYVVKKIIGVIGDLLGFAGNGAGGFLAFTGGIGDFVVALQKAIVEGDALGGVFQGITNVLRVPLEIVKALASAFFGLFEGVDSDKVNAAGESVKGLGDKLKPMENILERIKEAAKKTINFVNKLFEPFSKFVSGLGKMFANIGTTIADAFKGANSDQIIKVIQTGLLGGIFVALKKGISGGDFFINPLKEISGVMDTMTNSLKSMQAAVKAGTILAIGTAIVALAGGVKILSTIDGDKLKVAMTAVAIGLGQLVAALAFLEGATTLRASASLPLIAAAMVGLAAAVVVLAGAMKIFATMSWDEIERGLVGVGGALAAIGVGVKTMGGVQLTAMAPGLVAVAVAMNILGVAMKIFGGMEWDEIAKGMIGLGGSLAAMSVGLEGIQRSVIVVGPGLIAAGLGVAMLAGAVSAFGNQDLLKMIQGTIGMAGALTLLSEAMWRMPPGPMLAGQAAGLVILAVALTGIAGAIKVMGGMDIATIAKGLITLGAAMFELSIGLDLMAGTAPGSLALLGAAAAFAVLGPAIAFMGVLKWGTILKGLAAMAGALLVMATVGSIAAPALAAMGVALTFLGVAIVTIGAGVYLIAKALIMLGDASVKSTGILIAAITAFVAAIPKMVIDFLKGLVEIIAGVAEIAPKVVDSLTTILNSLIQVVINSTPKLAEAIGVLVSQILKVIVRDSPKLIQAGVTLILNLLRGLDNNISQVVSRASSIVIKFLNGLADKAPALTAAGGRALTQFLLGIARQTPDVIAAGIRVVVNFLRGVTQGLPKIVDAVVDAVIKFVDAVGKRIPDVVKAGVRLASRFVHAAAKGLVKLAREGADAIIDFMHGIADVIRQKGPELMAAGADIAAAIVEGFIGGLADMRGVLSDALNEAVFNNEGPGSEAYASEVKNLQNLRSKGRSRRDIEKMRLGYTSGQLDQVFGPRRKVAADAKARGKETTHKFAEGAKEGGKEVQLAVEETTAPLKKPTVMGPIDPKPMLKQMAADLNPAAPEVKKVEKEVDPLGIRIGSRLVNGLKAGLRGILPIMASGIGDPIAIMLRQTKSMREFGKFLGGEFRQGLTGGLWDDGKSDARRQIEDSFKSLRAKLAEENGKLRSSLKEDQDQLKQLMNERDKDWGKINALRARVAQERALLAQSKDASEALMRTMRGEQTVLVKLAANYEQVSRKLENAKAKLDKLKDERKSAINDYKNQFGQLPDLGSLIDDAANEAAMTWAERWDALRKKQKDDQLRSQIDQVAVYKKSLQDQIAATTKYMETLNQLRAAGVDDATYKKLLSMGTAGQEFASQLLRGGPGAISQINALDKQLKTAAGDLAKTAGDELYQAGIRTAEGLVKGLKDKQSEIRKAMESIASSMVYALKLALHIKSPSRVFAEIGGFTVQGLAEGLTESAGLVTSAAAGIGDDAADALTNSLANISDRVQNDVDTDITLTPVLDLSQVQKDASKLQDLGNVIPITAAASYGQAAAISEETQTNSEAQAESGGPSTIEFNFEQKNESPKALDPAEIYRQTKNQLSQVKSLLGVAATTNP